MKFYSKSGKATATGKKAKMQKRIRKILCFAVLVLTVICVFCSCQGNQQPTTDEANTSSDISQLPITDTHTHSFGEWAEVKSPTCTENGVRERLCSCGEKQMQDIPATGHTIITDAAIPATCSSTGLTEGTHCSICGEIIEKQNVVPMLEHTYGNAVMIKEPSCSAEGINKYTCSVCGNIHEESIPKKEHTPVKDAAVDATCTSTGLTEGTHCSVCGAIITKQNTVQMKEHSWDGGMITKAATCTEKGVTTYKCTVCGTTKKVETNALGHSPDQNGKCTRCGSLFMNMSSEEQKAASEVEKLDFSFYEYSDSITIKISLKGGKYGATVEAPAFVDIKVVNSLGVTIYSETIFKPAVSYFNIELSKSNFAVGNAKTGKVYTKVYNTGYFTFEQIEKDVDRLPWTIKMTLSTLPKIITEYGYNNSVIASCKITKIAYEISEYGNLCVYFSGEKTYDKNGAKYSRDCKVGWKLYDAEGNVVDTGTFYTDGLSVGEKFKDKKYTIYADIIPGKSYKLTILDVG